MPRPSGREVGRVLIEALRSGKLGKLVELDEIASKARTSKSFVMVVLTNVLGAVTSARISLDSTMRVRVAIEAAREGRLRDAAKAISWQEFEEFTGLCLREAGFRTETNLRVNGNGRAWQIDVVGARGDLVLVIDCKHWNTASSLTRFKLAADHQRRATSHFLTGRNVKTFQGNEGQHALPIILTLSEPPAQIYRDVVLVSVEKLPSFLSEVTPYDESLPFLTSPLSVVENPMSQSK